MTLDKILEEINKADSIVILTHENPDGDAIGSSLAMYNILKACGKNPDIIIPEFSKIFNFLPGISEIKKVQINSWTIEERSYEGKNGLLFSNQETSENTFVMGQYIAIAGVYQTEH